MEDQRTDDEPDLEQVLKDAEVGEAPQRGDPMDQAYVEHAPVLRRVAIAKFGIPTSEADGLVHDVFMTYLTNPANVRGDLRKYLIGGICNASRNYWRIKRAEDRMFANVDDAHGADFDESVLDGLAANLMVAATLARVGPRCREALRRYYLMGDATPAIAAALSTSPGNVNYIMHVCRKRAREIYEAITRVPS